MTLPELLNRFGQLRKQPGGYMARCPAHEDRDPSLSLTPTDDRLLVHCHAGCPAENVCAAVGITTSDLFFEPKRKNGDTVVASYDYTDEVGRLLFQVVRAAGKNFWQRRPDPAGGWRNGLNGTRRVLYHLPNVICAVQAGQPVYVVEGEKDVHSVEAKGAAATCNPMGAGKWSDEYSDSLHGAHVLIVADKDPAGRRHATQIAASLDGKAATIRILEAKEGKDATDHLQAGHTLDDLIPVDPTDSDPRPGGQKRSMTMRARTIRLTPAASIKPRPVRWHWDGRIPVGEITLTPGKGGIGKSTFHTWAIAATTKGTLPGAHYGTPKRCLVATSEDSWAHTVVPRLIAAGANLDLVYRVQVVLIEGGETSLCLPADCDLLEEEIISLEAVLLSVDPLMSTISGSLDSHKDRDVRQALEPLHRLAERTGCVVLGNAHFNKGMSADAMTLLTGSAAFGNVPRAVLGFVRDPEDQDGACIITQVKNNLGRLDLPSLRYLIEEAVVNTEEGPARVGRLVMTGESERSVHDILGARGDSEDKSAAEEFLSSFIPAGEWVKAKDALTAAKAEGIPERSLQRHRKDLGYLMDREGFGPGSIVWWGHPAASPRRAIAATDASNAGPAGMASAAPMGRETAQTGHETGRGGRASENWNAGNPRNAEHLICRDCGRPLGPGTSLLAGRCRPCHDQSREAS